MRVLLLVTGFPSSRDPQRGIFNLRSARQLATEVDVTVAHLRGWRPGLPFLEIERDGKLSIHRISVPQMQLGSLLPDQLRRLNIRALVHFSWRYARQLVLVNDLIHSVGALSAAIVASDWSRRSGLAHVVQAIGDDFNLLLPKFADLDWVDWHRRVDGIACNSAALQCKVHSLYPSLENVHTVKRGVDLQEFSPTGACSGRFQESARVRFLFLGGFPFEPAFGLNQKGGETLLAAWSLAEKKGIAAVASLTIGGPGSDAAAVHEWLGKLKCPEAVQIAGPISFKDVSNWLRGCDAVLIPSLAEGMPNVAAEAAACGKPVIGRVVGGLPEIVQHRRTGLLFESTQPEDWAEILLESARDPGKLKSMGDQARSYAAENLSSSKYAITMLKIYEEALTRRKGTPESWHSYGQCDLSTTRP